MFLNEFLVEDWIFDEDIEDSARLLKIAEAIKVILHEFSHYKRINSCNYDYLKKTLNKLYAESGIFFENSLNSSNELFLIARIHTTLKLILIL